MRCIFGTAPTLNELTNGIGETATAQWVQMQLVTLTEFYTLKERLSRFQLNVLSRMIVQQYGFLRVTEIMLFVYLFWQGKFGKIFNTISSQDVLEALKMFQLKTKNEIIDAHQND